MTKTSKNPFFGYFPYKSVKNGHFLEVFHSASTPGAYRIWLIFELNLSTKDTKLLAFSDFDYLVYFLSYRVNTHQRRRRQRRRRRRRRRRHTNGKVCRKLVFFAFHDFL